jgi:hypothetical protein
VTWEQKSYAQWAHENNWPAEARLERESGCPCPRRIADGTIVADLADGLECPIHNPHGWRDDDERWNA